MASLNGVEVDVRSKRFGAHPGTPGLLALEHLRFDIPRGQFVCVVGPSGCGKTTLLNIAGGLDVAFEGSVRVGGTAPRDAARTGMVFQSPRLMPWLSVRDNLRLVLDSGHPALAHIGPLLDEMGLGDFEHAYPGQLSGGMQRRVALARALITQPEVLLLDEPFVSLDTPTATRLRELLMRLWSRQPTSVLFVTHDLREALELGDRVLFLSARPGRVILDQAVDLERPRRADHTDIDALRLALLERHPRLLSGVTGR